MTRIKTVWGEVKLISSNLEGLYINGFCIPLDKTSEYVDDISVPNGDFIKRIIEKRLEKEVLFAGEKEELSISCKEESCEQEVVALWKICFEMIKNDGPQRKEKKLVELRFSNTKRNIPFEIRDNGIWIEIWIEIGKKQVQVPILIHPTIKSDSSIVFNLLGCSLEGIYR